MADVRPFRAVTYARRGDITRLTAPPYDVIPAAQRDELLALDEHNIVALELPEGPLDPSVPGNRYETGAARWRGWFADGILTEDVTPAVYLLEQRFELGGRTVQRRGFVAAVRIEPFGTGVILPHERTLPKALSDRFELLRATGANLSQVFALYHDPDGVTDAIMDGAQTAEPMLEATDEDGVVSRVWAIREPSAIEAVSSALAGESLFIADGHHRYGVALAYRDERRREAGGRAETGAAEHEDTPEDAPPDLPRHDFVMMALVNMDDPELVVLPTHRVADAPGTFDSGAFLGALAERFEVTQAAAGRAAIDSLEAAERPAFLVKVRGDETLRLAVARPGWTDAIRAPHSEAWKQLDVAVLQELVLGPLLDIHPDRPATLERLTFEKDAHEALRMTSGHDAAFVVRATRMDQMRAVALAGETMPQKSTYFYPKLRSGLLMRRAR